MKHTSLIRLFLLAFVLTACEHTPTLGSLSGLVAGSGKGNAHCRGRGASD